VPLRLHIARAHDLLTLVLGEGQSRGRRSEGRGETLRGGDQCREDEHRDDGEQFRRGISSRCQPTLGGGSCPSGVCRELGGRRPPRKGSQCVGDAPARGWASKPLSSQSTPTMAKQVGCEDSVGEVIASRPSVGPSLRLTRSDRSLDWLVLVQSQLEPTLVNLGHASPIPSFTLDRRNSLSAARSHAPPPRLPGQSWRAS